MDDHRAIDAVLKRYCTAVDRADLESCRDCFFDDAVVDYRGLVSGSVGDLVSFLAGERGLGALAWTAHALTNVVIRVDGGRAETEALCTAHHFSQAEDCWCQGLVVAWCRYVDRFEQRDGSGWRIARRVCRVEGSLNQTSGTWLKVPRR